jgi:hypothetical protein
MFFLIRFYDECVRISRFLVHVSHLGLLPFIPEHFVFSSDI